MIGKKLSAQDFAFKHGRTLLTCIQDTGWWSGHEALAVSELSARQALKLAECVLEAKVDPNINIAMKNAPNIPDAWSKYPEMYTRMNLARQLLSQPTTFLDFACGLGANPLMIDLLLRYRANPTQSALKNVHGNSAATMLGRKRRKPPGCSLEGLDGSICALGSLGLADREALKATGEQLMCEAAQTR